MAVALQLKIETKGSRTRLDQLERLDRTLQKNAYRLSDVELHQYLESQDNVQSRYETEFSTLMKDFKTKVENMVEQQSRRVIQHRKFVVDVIYLKLLMAFANVVMLEKRVMFTVME